MLAKVLGFICRLSFSSYMFILGIRMGIVVHRICRILVEILRIKDFGLGIKDQGFRIKQDPGIGHLNSIFCLTVCMSVASPGRPTHRCGFISNTCRDDDDEDDNNDDDEDTDLAADLGEVGGDGLELAAVAEVGAHGHALLARHRHLGGGGLEN